MRTFPAFLIATLLLLPSQGFAQEFAYERTITIPTLAKQTPVWVELDSHALSNKTPYRVITQDGTAVAFKVSNEQVNLLPEATIDSAPSPATTTPPTAVAFMVDGNSNTVFQPVASTKQVFMFHFDQNVAPEYLTFQLSSGWIDGMKVRLGSSPSALHDAFAGTPSGSRVKLPGENARFFEVTLTTREGVLQIAEAELLAPRTQLLFLAQPGKTYRLQYGTQSQVSSPANSGVYSDTTAITGALGPVRYIGAQGADSDQDGTPETLDNCVNTSNPDQRDRDSDGLGDACDNAPLYPNMFQNDEDKDGIGDAQDNCPKDHNSDQKDTDFDGVGWVCDDDDGDGIQNNKDNCVGFSNRDQRDLNNNKRGDACEDDRDGDGVPRAEDNCSTDANPDQSDNDRDGIGDTCDVCPEHYDPKQIDRDGNRIGDVCQSIIQSEARDTDADGTPDDKDVCTLVNDDQTDTDGDGMGNACDNCPALQNADQYDRDRDGKGDVCSDTDKDGVLDPYDNCVPYANADQKDKDEDGTGNPCDDDDADGIENGRDNCPFDPNYIQSDEDLDGTGNVCDKTDSRWTADKPWLLWVSMTMIILMLAAIGTLILKRTKA